MEHIAYQLANETWTGSYIWLNKEIAKELAEQMNKDRKKIGLEPNIIVKEVYIQ